MTEKNRKNIVIKIGGSLLFNKDKTILSEIIIEFCDIIKEANDFGNIVVICGGGILARVYINAVREFGGNEALCDTFGIDFSRINSRLIIANLGDHAYPQVPKSIEELSSAKLSQKIIVMGGLQPGQSTTSVALEVAEFINADEIIILTDVDGIYDKDPKKFEDAQLLKHLNYNQIQDLIIKLSDEKQAAAGEYRIFDAVSLQIIKRSKINVRVMSGIDLHAFRDYWNGKEDITCTIISD